MSSPRQILAATILAALSVSAAPAPSSSSAHLETRDETFNIHVHNNCAFEKEVSIWGVSSTFQMINYSTPCTIQPGGNTTIAAPYHGVGLRLTGHAEWTNQWQPQALFEFGYSSWGGVEGTAYDLSLMEGSDMDISMSVEPISNGQGSATCESKLCYPWAPTLSGCWTNPDQLSDGSPADTVCYKGKTDFKVTYCAA